MIVERCLNQVLRGDLCWRIVWFAVVTIFCVFPVVWGGSAEAQGAGEAPHAVHRAGEDAAGKAPEVVALELLDLELLDQDGNAVRFRSDVIGDRIVVMNFIFTTCTTVCPILTQIFVQVQEILGERLGREVILVSVSVDPVRDTPARLKAFAEGIGARPGWIFLTGEKRNVDRVLEGLDSYSADIWEHAVKVLIGDGRHGGWTSLYGFPPPEEIVGRIDELDRERGRGEGGTHEH